MKSCARSTAATAATCRRWSPLTAGSRGTERTTAVAYVLPTDRIEAVQVARAPQVGIAHRGADGHAVRLQETNASFQQQQHRVVLHARMAALAGNNVLAQLGRQVQAQENSQRIHCAQGQLLGICHSQPLSSSALEPQPGGGHTAPRAPGPYGRAVLAAAATMPHASAEWCLASSRAHAALHQACLQSSHRRGGSSGGWQADRQHRPHRP